MFETMMTRDVAAIFRADKLAGLDPHADAATMAVKLMNAAEGRLRYCPNNNRWYAYSGMAWRVIASPKKNISWLFTYVMECIGEDHYYAWIAQGNSSLHPDAPAVHAIRVAWKQHGEWSAFVRQMIHIIKANPEWRITAKEAKKVAI